MGRAGVVLFLAVALYSVKRIENLREKNGNIKSTIYLCFIHGECSFHVPVKCLFLSTFTWVILKKI